MSAAQMGNKQNFSLEPMELTPYVIVPASGLAGEREKRKAKKKRRKEWR